MRPGEINWDNLRTEYVTTGISHRLLADKHKIGLRLISQHSKEEKWVEKRKEYRIDTASRAHQKKQDKDVNQLAELTDATQIAIDRVMKILKDEKQFHRHIVYESPLPGTSEAVEKICDKADTKALKDVVNTLKELTGMMRDFYNIPTPAQAEAQRIAAERLALEQKRADADHVDKDIHVVIGGDAEDYSV